jgi:hypothetical protein
LLLPWPDQRRFARIHGDPCVRASEQELSLPQLRTMLRDKIAAFGFHVIL